MFLMQILKMKSWKTFITVRKPPMDEQYSHIYLPKGLCSHSNAIYANIYRYYKSVHIHNK